MLDRNISLILTITLLGVAGWFMGSKQWGDATEHRSDAPPQAAPVAPATPANNTQADANTALLGTLNQQLGELQSDLQQNFSQFQGTMEQRMQQLDQQQRAINQQFQQLQTEMATLQQQLDSLPTDPAETTPNVLNVDNAALQTEAETLTQNARAQLDAAAINAVDNNRQWQLRQQIENVYSGQSESASVTIESLNCSSDVCKLELNGRTSTGEDPLTALWENNVFPEDTEILTIPDPQNPDRWILYVGEAGKSLPIASP